MFLVHLLDCYYMFSKDAGQRNYITVLCREIKQPVRKMPKKYLHRSLMLWTHMKGTILVPLHNRHLIYVEEEVSFLLLPCGCILYLLKPTLLCLLLRVINICSQSWDRWICWVWPGQWRWGLAWRIQQRAEEYKPWKVREHYWSR